MSNTIPLSRTSMWQCPRDRATGLGAGRSEDCLGQYASQASGYWTRIWGTVGAPPHHEAEIETVPVSSVEITIISACTTVRCQFHPKNASGQDRFSFPLMKGSPKCCRDCIFLQPSVLHSAWINCDCFAICHTTATFLSLPAWVFRGTVQYAF